MSEDQPKEYALGVLECDSQGSPPFTEAAYCRKLCKIGHKYGVQVVVFSPRWVHWHDLTVSGYVYGTHGWVQRIVPLPSLLYDRCAYSNSNQYRRTRTAIARLIRDANVTLLGIGLRGKWDVYQSLSKEPFLLDILPRTRLFAGAGSLADQLNECGGELFLKPHGGTHGKSTLHVRRLFGSDASAGNERDASVLGAYLQLRGRDERNRPIHRTFAHPGEGLKWIARFIGKRKFIVQPYLTLVTQTGEPFDIRILMQKNEKGRWSFTGMAARVGRQHSITSNLHGGGHAVSVVPFLESQFEPEHVQRLVQQLRSYSEIIPPILEARHGRLTEVGLDFGIDREARLWLLEVNSKPGRSVFRQTGEQEAAIKSVENPILYARYVMVRYLRRVSP
ncbi:YheC/YheD family protein [Paenibacillus profundus]|uniref:YheC/YheD family protein n=1 Tax=Paenibacillus profundus TaxID=1173085 RepID=A0ABS8YLE6_9BACL|nr:YheC/YheD family protein [Paenibacillus profundus]MCE5171278.1 YheC/YheD family protein [Paenibacillus profundus]